MTKVKSQKNHSLFYSRRHCDYQQAGENQYYEYYK